MTHRQSALDILSCENTAVRAGTKPGLWTMDLIMGSILDLIMVSILDLIGQNSVLDPLFKEDFECWIAQ